jgi:uncharacterized protein (TIGR02145 family)
VPSSSSTTQSSDSNLCGGVFYDFETHFCYNNSKIGQKCNGNPQDYDPDKYGCNSSKNGVFLKNFAVGTGTTYSAVLIGEQTWIARNLNENISGRVCYGNEPANCAEFGGLYNWATAMNLPSNCNTENCASLIGTTHKGICPQGWHIPTNTDWATLSGYVDGTNNTANGYVSTTAGRILRTSWGYGGNIYGFEVMAGGYGSPNLTSGVITFSYLDAGWNNSGRGFWWSTPQYTIASAYLRYFRSGEDGAFWGSSDKRNYYSVRCIMN